MDDGKGMARNVWVKDRKSNALPVATYRPHEVEPDRVGPSVLDSPFLAWVTLRPETLERRPLPLPQRIALNAQYIFITLLALGALAFAGYIEGL
jgi:hypothetical protein